LPVLSKTRTVAIVSSSFLHDERVTTEAVERSSKKSFNALVVVMGRFA
jgi:hypothetical protein